MLTSTVTSKTHSYVTTMTNLYPSRKVLAYFGFSSVLGTARAARHSSGLHINIGVPLPPRVANEGTIFPYIIGYIQIVRLYPSKRLSHGQGASKNHLVTLIKWGPTCLPPLFVARVNWRKCNGQKKKKKADHVSKSRSTCPPPLCTHPPCKLWTNKSNQILTRYVSNIPG